MEFGSGTISYYNDSVAWSPDGDRLAVASEDGNVRIWDTSTFELIIVLEFEPENPE